ncbi:DUF2917 domain-containing protein [Jeongeupia sp. USM3]|uniref:DUF2917 domain-containing protein n=1 Tax=Jeongeupia sp. USM3 TaxID=1906741 RepID=UPI00089E0688|nr:DUF2917 domain-containing protein [Jeongeupia sp. USM3]AOX99436.1 hypothetical protein BJP62_02570 [Jeongeupia sp. USM3]
MKTLTLESGQLHRLVLTPGRALRCTAGSLWLTLDGEDVTLRQGEQWTAPVRGTALVEAISVQARLQLSARSGWLARLTRHRQPTFGAPLSLKWRL